MKKYVPLFGLVLIFMLLTAFIMQTHTTAVEQSSEVIHSTTSSKMEFWTKAALFGSAVGGYAFMRRRMRRNFGGGGFGCLGFLVALVIGVILIVLLPLILIAGLVLWACGVFVRRPRWRRGWRRR